VLRAVCRGRPAQGIRALAAGLHLRDCLDLVAKRAPGLIQRFGGHAQAAGLTIAEADYERFCAVFESTLEQLLPAEARLHTVETDGALEARIARSRSRA